MNRFSAFLLGLAIGAGVMFTSLKYHIVRARDGFHMIAKTKANLGEIYTDVRGFTIEDWRERQNLMFAITESDNDALKEQAARSTLGNTFENAWESWSGTTP